MQASGTSNTRKYTAIVMAGNRGDADPVAAAAGKSHKCLVEVAGKAMLVRILESLEASERVGPIVLCVEDAVLTFPAVGDRLAAGSLKHLASAASPARSALKALDRFSDAMPLLIVTGDHPLLTPDMIDHFCAAAEGCDVGVGLAPAELVTGTYPDAVRTLLRFADAAYCGCNLFALNGPAARRAVAFWVNVESARKRPWRMIRTLGIAPLILYWRRRLSLDDAMRGVSKRLKLTAQAVPMPFADAAIDVDKLVDLALAEAVLLERGDPEIRIS